ncbi:MAG: class I SAM-dependent methyltransferase [bacterium]|nr:class I SAM-dependent methyltransferase [bacterium]
MESLKEEFIKTKPYSALADIYDVLMEHVDYAGWTDYIFAICTGQGHSPVKILECACGTGLFLAEFLRRGVKSAAGFDYSLQMVKSAKKKLDKTSSDYSVFQSDLIAIPVRSKFDTVLCFYDSINYLKSIEDVELALKNMWDLVMPGGVLIFDVSTEQNSLRNFDKKNYSFKFENFNCKRRSFYRQEDRIQITDIMITDKKNAKTFSERHIQYIYPYESIYRIAKKLSPAEVLLFNDYSFDPPDEDSERVHFFVRK